MAEFERYKHLFALIYIIPSLILYFIVLHRLFFSAARKQKFSSVFYKIFGFSAIIYIIHALIYYFLIRLPTIPFLATVLQSLPKENFCYPILFFILYFSGHAVHFCNFITSFNRFTIFFLKLKYNNFWKKYLKLIFIICIIGPVILVWNVPFIGIQKIEVKTRPFYIDQTLHWPSWMRKSQNLVIQICVTATLSLSMNLYFIFSLINRRIYGSEDSQKISSQDIALFLYSFLVFLSELLSAFTQALLLIDMATFSPFIVEHQYLIADLTALAPVWFILISDKILRKEVSKVFNFNNTPSQVRPMINNIRVPPSNNIP